MAFLVWIKLPRTPCEARTCIVKQIGKIQNSLSLVCMSNPLLHERKKKPNNIKVNILASASTEIDAYEKIMVLHVLFQMHRFYFKNFLPLEK